LVPYFRREKSGLRVSDNRARLRTEMHTIFLLKDAAVDGKIK
jgi:hypothetical protein